jgi:DNA-damage-inducible protein D
MSRKGVFTGCSKWENFEKVINKAKEGCRNAQGKIEDHFPDFREMVDIGSGSEREIADFAFFVFFNNRSN